MTTSHKRCINFRTIIFIIAGMFTFFILANAILRLNDMSNEYSRSRARGPSSTNQIVLDDSSTPEHEETEEEKINKLEEKKRRENEYLAQSVNVEIPLDSNIPWDYMKALAIASTRLCPEEYPGYNLDEIQQYIIKCLLTNSDKQNEVFNNLFGTQINLTHMRPSRMSLTNAVKVYLNKDAYLIPNSVNDFEIFIYDEKLEEPYYFDNGKIAVSSPEMAAEVALSNRTDYYAYMSYLMYNNSYQAEIIVFLSKT